MLGVGTEKRMAKFLFASAFCRQRTNARAGREAPVLPSNQCRSSRPETGFTYVSSATERRLQAQRRPVFVPEVGRGGANTLCPSNSSSAAPNNACAGGSHRARRADSQNRLTNLAVIYGLKREKRVNRSPFFEKRAKRSKMFKRVQRVLNVMKCRTTRYMTAKLTVHPLPRRGSAAGQTTRRIRLQTVAYS